jgi:hypothetical protein
METGRLLDRVKGSGLFVRDHTHLCLLIKEDLEMLEAMVLRDNLKSIISYKNK